MTAQEWLDELERLREAASLGTSIKMEPSISLCRLTVYPIKILVANGAPYPNPARGYDG